MKINSINNDTNFTNKCFIQGKVSDLKKISNNVHKSGTAAKMFHPGGIINQEQTYADLIIANENDIQIVDEFLKSDKVWSEEYGKFGTSERGINIIKDLWGDEEIKILNSEEVSNAMNNNKFDYKTLDIKI